MVGIVLVSHSFELAKGAAVLSRTMAGDEALISFAGGLDTPNKELGTDPMLILKAIEEVYSPDGVLVFVDMGSALLSTEFAIQMLDEEKQPKVVISDAPFIEGAVNAAVQTRMNSSIDVVLKELKTALFPKQEQLGTLELNQEDAEQGNSKSENLDLNAQENKLNLGEVESLEILYFKIENTYGIHARPAAKIVALVSKYPYLNIKVKKQNSNKKAVQALSLNSIALLGLKKNDVMEFQITGENNTEFCKELIELANTKFGDDNFDEKIQKPQDNKSQKNTDSELLGLVGSNGIAQGKARILKTKKITIPDSLTTIDDPKTEWDFFLTHCDSQIKELNLLANELKEKNNLASAEIFYAHILILQDPVLKDSIKSTIFTNKSVASRAWVEEMAKLKKSYLEAQSDYMKERAKDIDELEQMLLAKLVSKNNNNSLDKENETPVVLQEGILIADDLSPAQTAKLDTAFIKGICTIKGSPTSHTAILARSLGIPALVGIGEDILKIEEGTPLILDADKGILYINPSPKIKKTYDKLQTEKNKEKETAENHKNKPAIMKNGQKILIEGNVGSSKVASIAFKNGADGIGLLRTEFLFLNRKNSPDEEEQYCAYYEIAKIMNGKPIIIRTLDIGGDKELPYLNLQKDENPFLGYRAIRMCLAEPDFFRVQLRAIIRVAQDYPIKIMFPMISSIEELKLAKQELEKAYSELKEKIVIKKRMPVGMMMEIPSAALQAKEFAKEVDFFSIGTNDLTQYTLAVERGNTKIASLYSSFNPAVLKLIKNIIDAAHTENIEVGVCGEFASDFEGAKLLCEFGVDSLSVNPPIIPRLKEYIRQI